MKYVYPACFYDEDGTIVVDFPDLGCTTEGSNLENAIEMAADAAAGWILEAFEHGDKLPAPSPVGSIHPDGDNGFVSLVYINLEELQKKHDKKLVKKTLGIPSWVNQAAEKQNINFSATLTEALVKKLES